MVGLFSYVFFVGEEMIAMIEGEERECVSVQVNVSVERELERILQKHLWILLLANST